MLAAFQAAQVDQFVFDRHQTVLFMSGLLNTFAIDNSLDELELCLVDAQPEVALLGKIIDEYKAGKKAKVSADLAKLALQLPGLISTCKGMTDDIARLESWATIFTDQTELVSTITKNIMANVVHFTRDIQKAMADHAAHDAYALGADTAAILELALGPVPQVALEAITADAALQLLSGFLTTFEVDNNLMELQTCTTDAGPEAQLALTILQDY